MRSRLAAMVIAVLMMVSVGFPVAGQTPVATPGASPAASPVAAEPVLPVTIQDAQGNDVEVTDVSRIVSLNGTVTETLFALGLGPNVMAVDVSALYPEAVTDLPKIGYQRELSAETILSHEPTLVIGNEDTGPATALDQVRAAGVTVVILPLSNDVEGAPAEIRAIGEAVGLPDAANAIADDVASTISEVEAATAGIEPKSRVAFLYLRGQGTQMMAGTDVKADAVITAAGGINVGAELGIRGYQPITPEALVAAAPDVILVMQIGLASVGGVEGLLAIPGVGQTPAAESGSIVAFEDLYLLGFGPRIGDAIHDLSVAFYPEMGWEVRHPEWQGTDVSDIDTSIFPGM